MNNLRVLLVEKVDRRIVFIIFLMLLVGIVGYGFYLSSLRNFNNTDKNTESNEILDMGISYTWYKDNFVRFQYPTDWTANVLTSGSPQEELEKRDIFRYEHFIGVYEINITDNKDFSFEIYATGPHGVDSYIYNPDKPKRIEEYDELKLCPAILLLTKKPAILTIDGYDISFLGISKDSFGKYSINQTSDEFNCKKLWSLSHNDIVYEGSFNNKKKFTGNGIFNEKDLPFLGTHPEEKEFTSMYEIQVKCSAGDDSMFTECFDVIKTFFKSAEKTTI